MWGKLFQEKNSRLKSNSMYYLIIKMVIIHLQSQNFYRDKLPIRDLE